MTEQDRLDGRATIADVAARAGVSIATVSRVVNRRYGVASATAQRVQQAIGELGYESNLVARSMRSQRTQVIGVLVSGVEPFSAELLKGAAGELERAGYAMMVYSGGRRNEAGWEQRYLSGISSVLADGTILVAPTVVDVDAPHPVVAVDPNVGGMNIPTIAAENFAGARQAVEHLIGLGHRRIGLVAGRPDLESARRREAGYRDALERAGIAVDPSLIEVGGFQEDTAAMAARTLLDRPDRPTAIFAANDLSAIEVIRVAGERGLRVPDDLSVVGFDNIPESALCEPPITTVDQSIQALGRTAVRALLAMLQADDGVDTAGTDRAERPDPTTFDAAAIVPTHIELPTRLVIRHSCGPVPGRP